MSSLKTFTYISFADMAEGSETNLWTELCKVGMCCITSTHNIGTVKTWEVDLAL